MKAASRRGENAILVCLVHGAPEVEIEWAKAGGVSVENSTKYLMLTTKIGLIDYKVPVDII